VGTPAPPGDVMLFCSVLSGSPGRADEAVALLGEAFGGAAFQSEPIPFSYTSYYEEEMGSPLTRIMLAFEPLVARNALPSVKNLTNGIEERLMEDGKRTVNLDPGILSLENICLATTKPYSHRIYLEGGIWAEVTLMYKKDSYQPLEWTYPDYASPELVGMFNQLRRIYKEKSRCRGA
jgi:hypothetical protein